MHLHINEPTVQKIIKATFPDFTGKRVHADISNTVKFWGTQWYEGYRRTYRILELSTMRVVEMETAPFLQRSDLHEATHNIPDGYIVVVRVDGRLPHIEIIAPPNVINPMLPMQVELSENEKIVLEYTKAYKSSYAGISNYRFHEAKRGTGITLDDWNIAKASLIEKKLLNKAGALTIEGRNVDLGRVGAMP